MKPTLHRDIVLDALLMAVWRRRPKQRVIIRSDQGAQFGSDDWARFMREHNLEPSMSRRGNCYDNAVAESFFSSLKKERTRKKSYRSRDELRADIFDYIEVFYNRRRRHWFYPDTCIIWLESKATRNVHSTHKAAKLMAAANGNSFAFSFIFPSPVECVSKVVNCRLPSGNWLS